MHNIKPNPHTKTLKLISKPLAMAIDGHIIAIRDDNASEITFFQIVEQTNDSLNANGVSTLRMSLKQLTGLKDAIATTIENHEKKAKGK